MKTHLVNISFPSKFDCHDQVTNEIVQLAQDRFQKVSLIKNEQALLKYLASDDFQNDKEVVLNWGAFITASRQLIARLPVSCRDNVCQRSVYLLEDYPFASWIYSDIVNLSSASKLITFEDNREPLTLIRPDLFVSYRNTHIKKPALDETKLSLEKYFDVLIAMDYRIHVPHIKDIYHHLSQSYHDKHALSQVDYDQIYEESLGNFILNPFSILANNIISKGIDLNQLKIDDRSYFDILMSACHILDMNVRRERRLLFIKDFMRRYKGFRTIICDPYGHLSKLSLNHCVTLLTSVPYESYKALLSRSRYTLFSNPTYPNLVNQRIIEGLNQGCLSICDYAPSLDKFYNKSDHAVINMDDLEVAHRQVADHPLRVVNTYIEVKKTQTLAEQFFDVVAPL